MKMGVLFVLRFKMSCSLSGKIKECQMALKIWDTFLFIRITSYDSYVVWKKLNGAVIYRNYVMRVVLEISGHEILKL